VQRRSRVDLGSDESQKVNQEDKVNAKLRKMSEKAFDIESQSLKIIDAEVGKHSYSSLEWSVVKRAIHSTADFDFSGSQGIVFGNDVFKSAFDAIRKKCSIVTDVEMVQVALNKTLISNLGLRTVCNISNDSVINESRLLNKTRSELAMRYSASDIAGGIVAIGNAPTALYEIIRMINERSVSPALVIGVPVGFVSAFESKRELAKTKIPFITNIGRKGGSAVASSIVNAILLLYQQGQLNP
jgi:precorrin-8X/cobalt-precorrin-8 methylmutase